MEDAGSGEGASALDKFMAQINQRVQIFKDKTTPHGAARWVAAAVMMFLYAVRIYYVSGFYIITYALGIYLLHLFIGFLSPKTDVDRPVLPTDSSNGKGFERRLSEFTFWWSTVKAISLSFFLTFIPFFDIPVFWPILVIYFFALCAMTMRRQIAHMMKYKYIPFDFGKAKYKGKNKEEALPGTTPTDDEAVVLTAAKSHQPPPGVQPPPKASE